MEQNNLVNEAYFLMIEATGGGVDYHEIVYLRSEEEVHQYIRQEYEGTDAACVAAFSTGELLAGQVYSMSPRQGMGTARGKIMLAHGSYCKELYAYLDCVELEDEEGEPVFLSDFLKDAGTEEEIEEVIEIFNNGWDNIW